MGLSISLLISSWTDILKHRYLDLSDNIETAIARSLSFGSIDEVRNKHEEEELERSSKSPNQTPIRKAVPLKDLVVGKDDVVLGSESLINEKDGFSVSEAFVFVSPRPLHELDEAATKLQKVYKSYRTRRNLADCAVVVEELWWKTLESAELYRSSESFFDSGEHETAASKWSRARRRASKVGKGLLKDEKAQKLALHHWLEAIDPRHRYGRNLQFYYDVWTERKSHQPFFYWLDIGDGKDVNLPSCHRVDLQRECIQYLGPKEREAYEVIVEEGRLVYKQSGKCLNTDEKSKWIFVLSSWRSLYIGQKKKGLFQHSSFLSGGVTTSAGRLVAHNGILEAIWPYSGHYLPTEDNFKEFISFLEEHHVDMTNVKKCSVDESPSFTAVEESSAMPETDGGDHSETPIMDDDDDNDKGVTFDKMKNRVPNGSITISTGDANRPIRLDLNKTLSCKWTSGVGPRIGCVRDYPMDLQSQALEKVNLSPSVVNPSPRYPNCSGPIPSPRPSPIIRVSPGLSNMGLPTPRVRSIVN